MNIEEALIDLHKRVETLERKLSEMPDGSTQYESKKLASGVTVITDRGNPPTYFCATCYYKEIKSPLQPEDSRISRAMYPGSPVLKCPTCDNYVQGTPPS